MSEDVWDQVLTEGEHLIWQGKPSYSFSLQDIPKTTLVVNFVFVVVGVNIFTRNSDGDTIGFLFALLFTGLAIAGTLNSVFGPTIRRRASFYSLSNKRAFIGRQPFFGDKTLEFYGITSNTNVVFSSGTPPTIYFATEEIQNSESKETRKIGFERISDAKEVAKLMGEIQQGQLK